MGDLNQLDWVLEHRARVRGPILEVGSKDHGNTNDFRAHFQGLRYVGSDLESGKGVDVVCDFVAPLATARERLGNVLFGTGICLSVLEHCRQPFVMAENLTALLEPQAVLFLSVPWVWNLHGFPDDYWRFSPSAVRVLFPAFEVDETASHWSTKNRGERMPLCTRKLNLHESMFFKTPGLAEELRTQGLTNFTHPYYCYPVMLNMLLVKKS